jgi:2-methylcitrate dehydratase PrpD
LGRFLRGTGSIGGASVLGLGLTTSAAWAALANGVSAHVLELDDGDRWSSLHPGVTVIPAALAVGEEIGASGRQVLEAIVAGYEVVMRVGAGLSPASVYRRGFHPTGVAGSFGASMAAGLLYGLDPAALTRGLGIAGSMASGSLEYLTDGAWTKPLNAGWASHAGVVAAGLAREGFIGPSTILEGPLGLLHAYSDAPDPNRLTAGLDEEAPRLLRVGTKPYGCCRYIHGLIDGVLALRQEFGLRPDMVVAIELGVLSQGSLLISEPLERKRRPSTVVEAQFSAPFGAALALRVGRAGPSDFTAERVSDPGIRALMDRTTCFTDPDLDNAFPRTCPAIVRMELVDGRRLERRIDYMLGEPENPLPRGALIERFQELAGRVVGQGEAEDVAHRLLALEEEPDLGSIMRLVRGAARQAEPWRS